MMKPQKEKEWSFFMIKIKEDLKFKNLTKTGDKFKYKNNIKGQDYNKTKKLHLNGNNLV